MIKYPFTKEDIIYKNKDGYQEILESFNNSPISSLFSEIDNNIIHRRSLKDFIKILKDGYIFVNNGEYEETPGSENCFAYKNNYISLFDFHQLPFHIFLTHDKWCSFFYDKKPVTVLMFLDRDDISEKMITNSVRRSCPNQSGQYFPYVETWYKDSIPADFITKIVITFVKNKKVLFENITQYNRIKSNDIPRELFELLQSQDVYIQDFCRCLLQISRLHQLDLEDPLTTILTSLK